MVPPRIPSSILIKKGEKMKIKHIIMTTVLLTLLLGLTNPVMSCAAPPAGWSDSSCPSTGWDWPDWVYRIFVDPLEQTIPLIYIAPEG
jgi:hypothetical protein